MLYNPEQMAGRAIEIYERTIRAFTLNSRSRHY
jgi:hypothetical protein